jgi:hypothetical protein
MTKLINMLRVKVKLMKIKSNNIDRIALYLKLKNETIETSTINY